MASGSEEEMVTFRLAARDRVSIQKLVEAGEFRNRSDFLRYAVKSTLASYDDKTRAKLDLEMEGVDLPPHGAPRKGAPRARSGKGVGL